MKLREIERLRGLAIVLVLLTHSPVLLGYNWWNRGWLGVDLFFVISGYVITRSLLKRLPDLRPGLELMDRLNASRRALWEFFVSRAYRLIPAAVISWAVYLGLAYFVNRTGVMGDYHAIFRDALVVASGLYNYALCTGDAGPMYWFWTLSVEEQFYLLLPFFLIALPGRSRRLAGAVIGIALVAFVLRPLISPAAWELQLPWAWWKGASHRRFDTLLAGVVIGLLRAEGWGAALELKRPFWRVVMVPFCVLLLWLLPAVAGAKLDYFQAPGLEIGVWFFAGVLVFTASLDRNLVLAYPIVDRILEYLGSRSYSLYLFHLPMYYLERELAAGIGLSGGGRRHFAAAVALALVAAELCYLLVEEPFRRAGRRRTEESIASADAFVPPVGAV